MHVVFEQRHIGLLNPFEFVAFQWDRWPGAHLQELLLDDIVQKAVLPVNALTEHLLPHVLPLLH